MDLKTCMENLYTNNDELKMESIDELNNLNFYKIADCLIGMLDKEKQTAIKEKILFLIKRLVMPAIDISLIERMFKSDDPFVRNATIEMLRQVDTDFLSVMSRMVNDEDKDIRKFVLDTLVDHSSREAVRIVETCLDDPSPIVRQAAIESLGNMGIKNASPAIETKLKEEENLMIKCTCLEALATIGYSPGSSSIIRDFSKAPNPLIMFSFIRYIGVFGDAQHFVFLEELIKRDKSPAIIQKVARAAIDIVSHNKDAVFTDFLIETIKDAIKKQEDENLVWELSRAFLFGLGEKGKEEAEKMMEEGSDAMKEAAEEYLDCDGDQECFDELI